ncbi:MAG: [protein-PII] uridylyltransferase [Nitrospirae bacterium]|nr:MAG: [protein-PII] uridylyltransferase [Nitrospirota bacterium]
MDFLAEIEGVFDKFSGRQLAEFYTKKIDEFLIGLFNSIASKKPLCLIAIGGYGRAELAPFSDIDIMFFAKDKTDPEKVEAILYKLWDSGLEIGHSYRTPEDCVSEARKDIRTHTALLEARFIAGDKGLYNYFHEKVYAELAFRKQKNFITSKLREMEKRHLDFGDSVYLLEPNVKEGRGGLRDIHTVLWLSRIAFKLGGIEQLSSLISGHDFKRLMRAYDFLLKVRFCLHILSRRRNDVLSFDTHAYISERIGFHDSKKFSSSERFMRYFYLKADSVSEVRAQISGLCARQWIVEGVRDFGAVKRRATNNFIVYRNVVIPSGSISSMKNPERIIEAFHASSKTGKKLSHNLREEIRKNLLRIGKKARSSSKAAGFFTGILRGIRVYETLKDMNETGVLGRFIPEFGALRSLVVYEPYHRYTVDEHTLLAIKNLELLTATKYRSLMHLSDIMKNIKEREMLFLALLFHDIGKAAGKRHEEEGYKRLKNIVERFNIDVEKRQRIEFLVRNHILMSKLALTRETEDPEIIAQFAEAAGDEESLRALYLMTYADMSAVNPSFWTEWKAYLLQELYEKTLNYLRGVRRNKDVYIKGILDSYNGSGREGLKGFIADMPERYLLSTPPERIYHDYSLAKSVREDDFALAVNDKHDGTTEVIIGTWDSPGLFSRVVGFLSSKWMNILSARLYTGKNGLVIDKIQISNWKELWWDGMDLFIKNGLKEAVSKDAHIALSGERKEIGGKVDVFIELDNETSEESTILEFFSSDRHGLLYDVSALLHEKELNIIAAKINTESGIAQDIFYIQHAGGKVNGLKAAELLASLWKTLKD